MIVAGRGAAKSPSVWPGPPARCITHPVAVDGVTDCGKESIMIASLDHLVLTVEDLDRTVEFYCGVLGMEKVVFGSGRLALVFGAHKINLHQRGQEYEPKAHRPMPGSADLCFISQLPLEQVAEKLKMAGISVIEGPVARTGARGPITSLYIRDPDLNLIEISVYSTDQCHF